MKDYLHNENDDLKLVNGDLSLTESSKQHQKDLLISRKCDYKLKIVGVDIRNAILDDEQDNFIRTIRREYRRDGMTVKSISFSNGKLKIDAPYDEGN
jgi:hypothetical protein